MSKHITEWLNAYLDGELNAKQLHRVEVHLAECQACQAELESLENLSRLLQEVPTPKFTSPERFATQVNLLLPHERTATVTSGKKILEIGWWMVPIGILVAWAFVTTAFVLSDVLSAAANLGLLSGISDWLASGPPSEVYWSTTIGQLGLLSGNGLNWVEATETFTRMSLPQVILQVSIALLYLSWIAIWWSRGPRHQRQQHGQLLEG